MLRLTTPEEITALEAIREGRLRRKVIYMLSAFGDESSDETHQRVFAVGALFGEEQQFESLKDKWNKRLPPGVIFHATDCESDHGDFKNFAHADNKALYKDLTVLLAESGLYGYGVVMDLISQNKYMKDLVPESPYYRCFGEVIMFFAHRAVMYLPKEQVKFTFDQRLETEFSAAALYNYMLHLPEWEDHEYLHEEIGFTSRNSVGIQAADLFVYEMMKYLDNQIGPKKRPERKSFTALRVTERFGGHFYMDEWFQHLQEAIAKLDASSDGPFNRGKYREWLGNNKLSDTYHHRLRYLTQCDAIARANSDLTHFDDLKGFLDLADNTRGEKV